MYLDWTRNCLNRLKSSNLKVGIRYHGLGPLHTPSKSRDHEIVRAQKKCPKVVPRHFQNHVMWSHALKYCSVKSNVSRPSTKCYFKEFLFMWGSHT